MAVYRAEPRKVDYPVLLVLDVDGPYDPDAVRAALDALRARHTVLRTAFPLAPELASTRILDRDLGWPLAVHDLRPIEPAARESWVRDIVAATSFAPYDPLVGDLVRGDLIRVADERWLLALGFEHLLVDGVTQLVLLEELSRLLSGESLPAPSYEHLDFAAAQRRWLDGHRPELVEAWRPVWETLGPYPPLPLPVRPGADGAAIGASAVVRAELPGEAAEAMTSLAAEHRTTPVVVGLAALLVALRRRSEGDDVGAVTPYAGRHWPGSDALVGPFFNLLLVGVALPPEPALRDAIPIVHDALTRAIANAETPYWELVRTFYGRQADGNPQRPYVFYAAGPTVEREYAFGEARARPIQLHGLRREKRFPGITVELEWGEAGLVASSEYVTDVYDREPVEELVTEVLEALSR